MFNASSMFMDFALMSLILCIAHLIRYKVRLFQVTYIPTSIIAGFIGLFGGYQFLNVLPFAARENGSFFMSAYPGLLITVLYATLFFGKQDKGMSLKKVVHNVGDTFFNCFAIQVAQYGLALLFGIWVLKPLFPALHDAFAIMMPSGFIGGHGVATAIGGIFEKAGWEDAMTVGYTSATVGLLAGLFGGIVLINLATRRGWTRFVKSPKQLPEYMLTGFIPPAEQKPMGNDTVHSIALESFSWHFGLVMAAYALGHYALVGIKAAIPGNYAIPHFATAMVAGFLIQKTLNTAGLGESVDGRITGKIGSWVTDYLVAFAVATIQVSVIVKYALPMLILFGFGAFFCVVWLLWVGPRVYHNFWFERSIFVYGFATGVVATGVTLLRVVDPHLKSKTLEDYGIAYVFLSFLSIAIPIFVPPLVLQGSALSGGFAMTVMGVVCLILSKYIVGWYADIPLAAFREDEEQIVASE